MVLALAEPAESSPPRTRVRVGGMGGCEAEQDVSGSEADVVQPEDGNKGRATSDASESGSDCLELRESELDFTSDVYITEAWREWERVYLKRLAKRVHRLVCKEFDRTEEALFMLFVAHDANLDGVVRGTEANQLIGNLSANLPAVAKEVEAGQLMEQDGSITLLNLLTWYGDKDTENEDGNVGFNIVAFAVGFVGSGMLDTDGRIDELSYEELKKTVVGYRRVLQQVRYLKEKRKLDNVRRQESERGLSATISAYHDVLAEEFEGDAEHLFELFCEVDEGGAELVLEAGEVESLLRLLDPDATEEDVCRYVEEINMDDGFLSFSFLMEWWTQAQEVSNSLVAEKGAALIAGIKARAMQRRFAGLFSKKPIQKRWQRAEDAGRLRALRQAYCRTYSELREVKMLRDLKQCEEECARS